MPNSSEPGWDQLADAFYEARMSAGYRSRSRFATEHQINDSTMQIIEGKRSGSVSEQMLDWVGSGVSWPKGYWRTYLPDYVGTDMDGPSLKRARERLDLSPAKLAKTVGVTAAAIGRWESGEPVPPARTRALREALMLDVSAPETPGPLADLSDVALLSELLRRAIERDEQ